MFQMMNPKLLRIVANCISIVAIVTGLQACLGPDTTKRDAIVWPKPPDDPRFIFETSLRDRDAIKKKSTQDLLFDAVTGKKNKNIFNKPYDVAASGGKIVVTDTIFNHALMFDVPRRRLFRFGVRNEGILKKPLGVGMDAQQFVYIADGKAKVVYKYDLLGLFQNYIGEKGDFEKPVDVAVSASGDRVYVIDAGGLYSENHGFVIFDKKGTKLREVRNRGIGDGQFNLPSQGAVAPDGTLYILDAGNFRIQAFSPEGDYLRGWGKVGRKLGEFARPRGLGVDTDGNVYVTDAQFRNFQIFSPEGELLMFIGGGDSLQDVPGQYALPAGITVDETNRVYVVDQIMLKVEVMRRLEEGELIKDAQKDSGALKSSLENIKLQGQPSQPNDNASADGKSPIKQIDEQEPVGQTVAPAEQSIDTESASGIPNPIEVEPGATTPNKKPATPVKEGTVIQRPNQIPENTDKSGVTESVIPQPESTTEPPKNTDSQSLPTENGIKDIDSTQSSISKEANKESVTNETDSSE